MENADSYGTFFLRCDKCKLDAEKYRVANEVLKNPDGFIEIFYRTWALVLSTMSKCKTPVYPTHYLSEEWKRLIYADKFGVVSDYINHPEVSLSGIDLYLEPMYARLIDQFQESPEYLTYRQVMASCPELINDRINTFIVNLLNQLLDDSDEEDDDDDANYDDTLGSYSKPKLQLTLFQVKVFQGKFAEAIKIYEEAHMDTRPEMIKTIHQYRPKWALDHIKTHLLYLCDVINQAVEDRLISLEKMDLTFSLKDFSQDTSYFIQALKRAKEKEQEFEQDPPIGYHFYSPRKFGVNFKFLIEIGKELLGLPFKHPYQPPYESYDIPVYKYQEEIDNYLKENPIDKDVEVPKWNSFLEEIKNKLRSGKISWVYPFTKEIRDIEIFDSRYQKQYGLHLLDIITSYSS